MAGRKKKNLAKEIEAEIFFSDITLVETEGNYDEIKKIMDADEVLGSHKWVLRSKVTTSSPFGAGDFVLNFWWNKKVYIVDYYGNYRDPYSNFDIKFLSKWCQANGWEIPEPVEYLAITNLAFWKHFWETSLVNSEYFDRRFSNKKDISKEDEEDNDEFIKDEEG